MRAAEPWLVVFEAVSHDDGVPYATRAELTAALVSDFGPPILTVLGLDATSFDAEIVPGGYEGRTNPSVLMIVDADAVTADRVAAGLGHVFEQAAVLVWQEGGGDSLAVSVTLPAVTPNLADHFFRHAAAVEPRLAGGFTARGNALVFINLRGEGGRPLNGMDDAAFGAALERAAAHFGGIASVTATRITARLVLRDAYAALLGPSALATLERMRVRRAELGGRR